MYDDSLEGSPRRNLLALAVSDQEWQPILHASNQVVLYNATSHALSIQTSPSRDDSVVRRHHTNRLCPYCHRRLSSDGMDEIIHDVDEDEVFDELEDGISSRVPNYFQLLQVANETASVPSTPPSLRDDDVPDLGEGPSSANGSNGAFRAGAMAEGYFKTFFQEECRLGMGANGTVYLCQHVLDSNPLGHFAVKKIAVGQSHSYLLNILREVRLLETLHHPNIIQYHHAWLETCQFSSFGPKVPTLHVLMQWAEGGSLDDFIDVRLGRPPPAYLAHFHTPSGKFEPNAPEEDSDAREDVQSPSSFLSRSARIRAFRNMQRAPPEERERLKRELAMSAASGQSRSRTGKANWRAVHLLSAEEVKSLFSDVVSGLAFLHDKSILHLDLKPGNVLLTWDEGKLIPRAMLSDFGTSQDMLNQRTRSGNTGTLEYTSPESLPSPSTGLLQQIDSKSDMWSLGMILYKLLFLRLPYRYASDNVEEDSKRDGKEISDLLEKEVREYPGFKATSSMVTSFESRRIPRAFLILLENLLTVVPSSRPSAERVLSAIREGRLDPLSPAPSHRAGLQTSLVPVRRNGGHPAPGDTEQEHNLSGVSDYEDATEAHPPSEKRIPLLPSDGEASVAVASKGPGWLRNKTTYLQVSRFILIRTLKSVILIAKVASISTMCSDTRLRLFFKALALGLAVVDTWFESLYVTLLLGALHMVLLQFSC
ncbi:unnamed protein product [Somion occarium]|uniref:Protein kinase domain-containing protein n=1 Tax=Somion occarium TaxID=3059160 RepID=A0ABP1DPR1_9APHY